MSPQLLLFERSEFLIDTSPKKICACARVILVKEESLKRYCCRTLRQYDTRYLVRTYNIGLHPPQKKTQNAWYQRALRCQLRGRPFHPWEGRLRFSGEAHPGPAALTQSSSFSCGAGLQSESRLLLCCAPVTRDHATHVYSSVHSCC